MHSSAHRELK